MPKRTPSKIVLLVQWVEKLDKRLEEAEARIASLESQLSKGKVL